MDLNKFISSSGFDDGDAVLRTRGLDGIVMYENELEHYLARHQALARTEGRAPCAQEWTTVGETFGHRHCCRPSQSQNC